MATQNNPNQNALSLLSDPSVLTMSSHEIAKLTGKEHPKVARDIRVMLIGLYGDEHVERTIPDHYRNRRSEYIRENADAILNAIVDDPDWDHDKNHEFSWTRDNRGYIAEFQLDRDHTLTLVAGYNVKLRKRIIDRWQELEEKVAKPSFDPMQFLNDPAAMRGLLLTYTEKVIALEAKVQEQAPKVEALDRIATADGALNLQLAAKTLQQQPNKFCAWLREQRWIYKRAGSDSNIAYQDKIQAGYLTHKTRTITLTQEDGTETEKVRDQAMVTPKGLARLATLLNTPIQGSLFQPSEEP